MEYNMKCGAIKVENMQCLENFAESIKIADLEKHFKKCFKPKYERKRSVTCPKIAFSTERLRVFNNIYLERINAKISLHDSSPNVEIPEKSRHCVLDVIRNGRVIYNNIIEIHKHPINENPDSDIFTILENFQTLHKKFSYYSVLETILKDQNSIEYYGFLKNMSKKKHQNIKYCENQVNVLQLQGYFQLILNKVVPTSLFGSNRNKKYVMKAISVLLRTARFQDLDLKYYINKINPSCISWLQSIEYESARWIIIYKLIKWFFVKYVFIILHRYVHVTAHPSSNGERLYILRQDWNDMKKYFIKKQKKKKLFISIVPYTTIDLKFQLFPKRIGVRPRLIAQYTTAQKEDLKLILLFLRQLYISHYEPLSILGFQEKWKSMINTRNDTDKKYLTVCDIDNAFDSVLLRKLYNIICLLSDNLPEQLRFKQVAYVNPKNRYGDIIYHQQFSDLDIALPRGSKFTFLYNNRIPNQKKNISKRTLLKKLRLFIFYQMITIGENKYYLSRGLPQGGMLSSFLFNIYYSFILEAEMSVFVQYGRLYKYEDDILYVTDHENYAKKFLQCIEKGILEYNCKFKKSKTQTNCTYNNENVTNSVNYLGYKIDCDTLEAIPVFPNTHPRYASGMLVKETADPIKSFALKICNPTCLKLSRILLINSSLSTKLLINTMKDASLIQAWRARKLIPALFDNLPKYSERIFEIIKHGNSNICKAVCNGHLKALDDQRYATYKKQLSKDIKIILWKSYKRVFGQECNLRYHFYNLINHEIRKLKR